MDENRTRILRIDNPVHYQSATMAYNWHAQKVSNLHLPAQGCSDFEELVAHLIELQTYKLAPHLRLELS